MNHPPPQLLKIPQSVCNAIVAHAHRELPLECCGLLLGQRHDEVAEVIEAVELINELRSEIAYRSEPKSLLAAYRQMRANHLEIVGIYHSHPTSPAIPSKHDLAENGYGDEVVHVILGCAVEPPEMRGWRLGDRAIEIEIAYQAVAE